MVRNTMDRHNFDPAYKLHMCCAEDGMRPVMEYVHFIGGYAYATNSYVMVRAKIADISNFTEEEIAMLDNKSIHGHLFRQLIQRRRVQVTPDGFVWDGERGDMTQLFKFHNINEDRRMQLDGFGNDLKIPNFNACIDDSFASNTLPCENIGIRVALVEEISRAMNTNELAFYFRGNNRTIHVLPSYRAYDTIDIVGILMPRLIDDIKPYERTIAKK